MGVYILKKFSRIFIDALLVCVTIFCVFNIYNKAVEYKKSDNVYETINESVNDTASKKEDSNSNSVLSKYNKLIADNEDYRCWLKMDNTKIDYPGFDDCADFATTKQVLESLYSDDQAYITNGALDLFGINKGGLISCTPAQSKGQYLRSIEMMTEIGYTLAIQPYNSKFVTNMFKRMFVCMVYNYHDNLITRSDIKPEADQYEEGFDTLFLSLITPNDNKEELELINKIAKDKNTVQKILFRIKPGIDAHTHDFIKTGQIDSKFGVALENGEAFKIYEYATTLSNIKVDGAHCHIGSQIFDVEPFCEAASVMMNFIVELQDKLSLKVNILNLGGGFGIEYTSDDDPLTPSEYIGKVAETVKSLAMEKNVELPFLVFEPGRSIVAPAGITLYTVGSIKEIENVRTYVSVDGGMGDNPRYILYGSKYSVVLANNAAAKPVAPVTVAGKCCESGDLIQENILMPEIKVGDTLAVLATGAYNYSMASNYNRNPRPPIVAIRGEEKKIIVKRETYDDIINNDLI